MATPVYIIEGNPDDTFTMNSTDASQGIDSSKYTNASSEPIKQLFVTVEDQPVRVAFDIDPVADGGSELGHVIKTDGSILIQGNDACKEFRFISKVAGSHAKLMLTPSYFA